MPVNGFQGIDMAAPAMRRDCVRRPEPWSPQPLSHFAAVTKGDVMNTLEHRSASCTLYVVVCGLALLSVPRAADAQPATTQMVVFGSSLSDPGNAFALRGGTNVPPDYSVDPVFLTPDRPYAQGGHHFSNGQTWIEQLARSLRLTAYAKPAFQSSSSKAANYAVGGARAREDGINVNLPTQVSAFLQSTGGTASGEALHVIEMGSNDVRDALAAGPGAPAILQSALTSLLTNVATLYGAGARKFVIWNVPNVALTPAIRGLNNPQVTAGATLMTGLFNQGLDAGILQLRSLLPGIEIVKVDVHKLLNTVVANPAEFGFSNVTTACITPSDAPFHCQNPDEYLFWDGIHPTTAMHAIVAQEAAFVLAQ